MAQHLRSQQPLFNYLFFNFTFPFMLIFVFLSSGTLYFFHHQNQNRIFDQLQKESLVLQQDTLFALTLARNTYIQSTNSSILEFIKTLYQRHQDGALTKSEVIWLTDEVLKNHKKNTSGQSFILNSEGKILLHPDATQIGKRHQQFPFIRNALETNQSFYSYHMPQPDRLPNKEVIASLSYFPPWQWIIATELPTEQSRHLFAFQDIVQLVKSTPRSSDFPSFFLNNHGNEWSISCGEGCSLQEEEMLMLAKVVAAQGTGHHAYTWKPSAQLQAVEKIAFFQEIKPFGITAGFVQAVAPRPFFHAGNLLEIFLILITTAVLLLLVTLFLNKRLAAPFRNFSRIIDQNTDTEAPLPTAFPLKELNNFALQYNSLLTLYKNLEQEKAAQETRLSEVQGNLIKEIKENRESTNKLTAEITSRKSAENYLQLFKNIFDNAIEGIMITDHNNNILTVNPSFSEVTGYSAREVTGKNPSILSSNTHSINFYRKMWLALEEKGSWSGEITNRKKDGTLFPEWLSISQIKDAEQNITNYFAFFHDITELKRKEQQISAMAYQDSLTKLPNRSALELRLTKAISRAKREKANLAILFIDLDNFKNVNDTLGHDKGDQLLIQVAERIKLAVRDEDTLSRLGGDEFILLSEALEAENSIFIIAGRILASLKEPFFIGHNKLFINASIGIATYPEDGRSTNELIKNADMAMYKAKSEGKNKFVMFTQQMQEKFVNQIRIENAIRTGLHNNEFILYYQPKIDIKSEKATSFEALVRWHRNGQIIGPSYFIPVAEESGLIDKMSLHLLEEVCRFLQEIKRKQIEPLPISVNMAPRTFNNLDIVETIDDILHQYSVDHKYIEFEVTETTAMENIQHTLGTMARFRQRGINFSIDDFGTGYSSLSYLNEMPVSTLKIDKRFINLEDSNCKSIVSTITAMSKQMRLKVVAEGVETMEQLKWLQSLGCDEAQGYYFSRPFPQKEVIDYLKNNK